MDQEETLEVAELGYGKVACQHGLHSLLATNAHSNVGHLEHRHIIGSVADAQCYHLFVPLHQIDNERLLQRSHSAADH